VIAALTFARPLIIGIANGAGYALVAIGLVLIYKSSRVFNFAAGEFVTLGAYATYLAAFHVPYLLAMASGVAAGAFAGLATERLVVRPLASRPKVTVLVATAAIATALIPAEIIIGRARTCLLYTSPSPRDLSTSRMPSSA